MQENTNQNYISIRNLKKIYPNGEKAVYDFNLDIEKNEFIVIVGPSGCGKSTTLRMIAGLEDISSGEIYSDGELLNYKECKDRKMAIVFQSYALYPQMNVFDNIAFPLTINKYPYPVVNEKLLAARELEQKLTSVPAEAIAETVAACSNDRKAHQNKDEGLATRLGISLYAAHYLNELFAAEKDENADVKAKIDGILKKIAENRAIEEKAVAEKGIKLDDDFCELDENGERKIVNRKMTPYEIKTRIYETAEILDLTPYLDKLPKELSGGQMQRVALGRAIVKNVPVFLMDEPLSNLDAKLRLTMRSEIVKLHNRINATTIYVTHDQTEAMTMASRIVVMSRGFVQQIGTPDEIYNHPANIFVAKFIGSPAMNFFEMSYDAEEGVLYNENVKIKVQESFAKRYAEFYDKKIAQFTGYLQNFDTQAEEEVLKVLSVIGEHKTVKSSKGNEKKSFLQKVKSLFKKEREAETVKRELGIAEEKLNRLNEYRRGGQKLMVGIRPERIGIEKCVAGKNYDNSIVLKPTVCELLGAEYNIHFDYCGKNMVGKMDAKEKVTLRDDIAVTINYDDIYIFDPITGDYI